jgi:hypothetical protein
MLPVPPLTDGRENMGMRKLIEDITIVKPKIERMHFMSNRGHSTLQQNKRELLLKPSESAAIVGPKDPLTKSVLDVPQTSQ